MSPAPLPKSTGTAPPRCRFGRAHLWIRRPDIDIDDCMHCGAVSDERQADTDALSTSDQRGGA